MNKLILAVGLVVAFVLVVSPIMAADVTVKGTVSVTKDGDNVTAISIKTADGDVAVTLDAEGKKLADKAGKEVSVTGTVTEKEGKKTITVKPAAEK
jgi:P pilus assembly chaperone PapD